MNAKLIEGYDITPTDFNPQEELMKIKAIRESDDPLVKCEKLMEVLFGALDRKDIIEVFAEHVLRLEGEKHIDEWYDEVMEDHKVWLHELYLKNAMEV